MNGTVWAEDAAEEAGGIDLLLTDAALGVWHRLRPDSSLLRLAGELARRPGFLGRQAARLGTELGRITAGRSAIAADPRDRRFADPAWTQNPFLRRSVQAYLAAAQTAEALVAGAELGWRDDTRMKFLVTNLIAAAAPSNNPLLSPVGWKALIETGGENAVRGLHALASDLATSPRVPSMVSADAFEVGRDLAVTPGGVVHATDQFELIQYQPSTEMVYRYPLLVVPPMINKYYIVDLAPGRSMVEFLVSMGHQVFVMSWRNPDARHRDWDLDTYGGALAEALAAVREVSGAAKTSVCALCSGGIMASMVAAHLGVTGQLDQLASLCLGVTVLDQSQSGTAGAFIDEKTAAAAMAISGARGYLDGRALAEVFAWLRPDDLIWNYWVNNYLAGRTPPAFDILYWNADVTRLPAALHHDFIRLGLANALVTPGAADHARLAGRPGQGRRGRVRGRGHHRSPVPVGILLPDHAAARRAGQVRAVDQRAHRGHGQPAGQPQGRVPDCPGRGRGQPGRPPGVPGRGDHGAGQLVDRLFVLAGRTRRRAAQEPADARPQGLPGAVRCARNLCPRPLRSAPSRSAASRCGSR